MNNPLGLLTLFFAQIIRECRKGLAINLSTKSPQPNSSALPETLEECANIQFFRERYNRENAQSKNQPTADSQSDCRLTVDNFQTLLKGCSLGERRPIDNRAVLQAMVDNSNLIITAWDNRHLIGVARAVTDFGYACYLSDLAVHDDYQKQGIGKKLIQWIENSTGSHCKLILLAAPDANAYYAKLGFENNPRCWCALNNA